VLAGPFNGVASAELQEGRFPDGDLNIVSYSASNTISTTSTTSTHARSESPPYWCRKTIRNAC
jgi:hypothetical protein